MKLKIARMHTGAKPPCFGHPGDAGLDLFSDSNLVLKPGRAVPVPTGIRMAVPKGHVGLIWDKSGISLKGVHRLAGVVDAGYRGEVKVVMINLSPEPYAVERGMKIAQMLIQPVLAVEVELTEDLDATSRGEGGFGSTGLF